MHRANSPYVAPIDNPVMMIWMISGMASRISQRLTHRARLRRAVLAMALIGLCGCSNPVAGPAPSPPSPSSRAIQGGPDCGLPHKRPTPAWFPEDVPMPKGTYFYKPLSPKRGLNRGLFVLRVDADGFRTFIDKRWRRAGISTLRPDREPGEVEDIFRTRSGTGVFKANDVICETPYTRLLLIYG